MLRVSVSNTGFMSDEVKCNSNDNSNNNNSRSAVHAADSTRLELMIPGEQYFYLQALNAAERQKWLVALGTAKACLADSRTKKEKGEN